MNGRRNRGDRKMGESRKTAIITGSTRGIGYAVAKQLASEGKNVVLVGTKSSDEVASALSWFGDRDFPYLYVQADVSEEEDRKRIVSAAIARFGRIDILVNNAGIAPRERKDLLEMEKESFDRLIAVNTAGPLFLTQLVAREMLRIPREERDCTIVFITSCSSVVSSVNRGEYCISKAAETMVATLFADRLAPEGILVHEVRPGVIHTDMTRKVSDKYDEMVRQGAFPVGRWGEPEDVALVVSAFCSGAFRYTTGNHIDVDGGFHIPRL